MNAIRSHKDLEVYKESMNLVEEVYKATKSFPSEERYSLTSQIRRSVVSVVSNIAEGAGRRNTKEYIQFLYISLGSLSELETQIDVSKRLKYIENTEYFTKTIAHINSMLTGLIRSLNNRKQS